MRPIERPPRVGPALRALREGAGLSQETLALRAGLHRTYVGLVERGERHPTLLTVTRLLDALGVTWRDFGETLERTRGRDPT